jgi:hypothetical protein
VRAKLALNSQENAILGLRRASAMLRKHSTWTRRKLHKSHRRTFDRSKASGESSPIVERTKGADIRWGSADSALSDPPECAARFAPAGLPNVFQDLRPSFGKKSFGPLQLAEYNLIVGRTGAPRRRE